MEADADALMARLWVVGAGRVGLALGLGLRRSGAVGELFVIGRQTQPPAHPLFRGDAPAATYLSAPPRPDLAPTAVLVAVPDERIEEVADGLARADLPAGTPVLHTSGALGAEALAPLARVGCAVGSVHPLVAVADPVTGADRLRGAWYALEAEGAARRLGERVVALLQGRLLAIDAGAKALYHAAAVFASNYVVTLMDVAERLALQAGAPREHAREALAGLAAGAVENVARDGPTAALTGPLARGDAETVARHLARLSAPDRILYSELARATLPIARQQGLAPAAADRLEHLLREDS